MFPAKKYNQRYRKKWENYSQFLGWLKPYPKDNKRAFCKYCNVIINAHLCDLKKHAITKKHANAISLLKTLKQVEEAEDAPNEGISIEMFNDDESDDDDDDLDDEQPQDRWPLLAVMSLIQHMKENWIAYQDRSHKRYKVFFIIQDAMAKEGFCYDDKEISRKYRNIKVRYFQILERKILKNYKPRIKYYNALHELFCNEEKTLLFIQEKESQRKRQFSSIRVEEEAAADQLEDENSLIHYGNIEDDEPLSDPAIDLLLSLVQEFNVFEGKGDDNFPGDMWQVIADHMTDDGFPIDHENCRKSFLLMVTKYHELMKPPPDTTNGFRLPLWRYYTRVRDIVNAVTIHNHDDTRLNEDRECSKRRRKSSHSLSQYFNDSDHSVDRDNVIQDPSASGVSIQRRIKTLGENAELWDRLHAVEVHLDCVAADQQDTQHRTNNLLSQILCELSTLSTHLNTPPVTFSREGTCTLVVPSSE